MHVSSVVDSPFSVQDFSQGKPTFCHQFQDSDCELDNYYAPFSYEGRQNPQFDDNYTQNMSSSGIGNETPVSQKRSVVR